LDMAVEVARWETTCISIGASPCGDGWRATAE
jgi:hypothetical protein